MSHKVVVIPARRGDSTCPYGIEDQIWLRISVKRSKPGKSGRGLLAQFGREARPRNTDRLLQANLLAGPFFLVQQTKGASPTVLIDEPLPRFIGKVKRRAPFTVDPLWPFF